MKPVKIPEIKTTLANLQKNICDLKTQVDDLKNSKDEMFKVDFAVLESQLSAMLQKMDMLEKNSFDSECEDLEIKLATGKLLVPEFREEMIKLSGQYGNFPDLVKLNDSDYLFHSKLIPETAMGRGCTMKRNCPDDSLKKEYCVQYRCMDWTSAWETQAGSVTDNKISAIAHMECLKKYNSFLKTEKYIVRVAERELHPQPWKECTSV